MLATDMFNQDLEEEIIPLEETGLEGIFMHPNFITAEEETQLVSALDSLERDAQDDEQLGQKQGCLTSSQSGRRKLDYGPRINYKAMKCKPPEPGGVPERLLRSKALQRILEYRNVETAANDAAKSSASTPARDVFLSGNVHRDFHPAGWFFQEYTRRKGSNFDAHIDHQFIWGDRILDLNMLSESVLSFYSPEYTPESVENIGIIRHTYWRVDVPLAARSLLFSQGMHEMFGSMLSGRKRLLAEMTGGFL